MELLQTHRSFVSYIDRSREYYAAQGYPKAYEWPRFNEVPFTKLRKPLSYCRIGLVTTAGKPHVSVQIDSLGFGLGVRELYADPTIPPPTHLFTDDLGWDKEATHTEDINSFLPLKSLLESAGRSRIKSVSPRFYGVPTDYSRNRTISRYAPQVLEWAREDDVDAIILSAL